MRLKYKISQNISHIFLKYIFKNIHIIGTHYFKKRNFKTPTYSQAN